MQGAPDRRADLGRLSVLSGVPLPCQPAPPGHAATAPDQQRHDENGSMKGKATPGFNGLSMLTSWYLRYASSPSLRKTLSDSVRSKRALDAIPITNRSSKL